MTPQITLQLYSLREQFAKDFQGTLEAIREIGFTNVEPAGYYNLTVDSYAKALSAHGLQAPSAHMGLPVGNDANELIENALTLGCRYIITGVPPKGKESVSTLDEVKRTAELYTTAAENAAKHGLFVGYHNHDWDLAEIDGQRLYKVFLQNTPDTVLWEADVFWVARAGIDPVQFIQEIGSRGRLLHLKDGIVADKSVEIPFRPCGEGEVNLIAAAKSSEAAELAAVELDAYPGEMLDAVRKSYQYLTSNNLAL